MAGGRLGGLCGGCGEWLAGRKGSCQFHFHAQVAGTRWIASSAATGPIYR